MSYLWLIKHYRGVITFGLLLLLVLFFLGLIVIQSVMGAVSEIIGSEKEAKQVDLEVQLPNDLLPLYREASREFHISWGWLMAVHHVQTDFARNGGLLWSDALDLPDTIWQSYAVSKREIDFQHEREAMESEINALQQQLDASEDEDTTDLEEQLADLEQQYQSMFLHHQPYSPNRDRLEDVLYTFAHYMSQFQLQKSGEVNQALTAIAENKEKMKEMKVLAWLFGTFYGVGGWPLPASYGEDHITSFYGERTDPLSGKTEFHKGIDIGATYGTPIFAFEEGVVTYAGTVQGYGTLIVIDHGEGLESAYGHAQVLMVSEGDQVSAGEQIGEVGNEGRSTGPHLHFEIRVHGVHEDPMHYITLPESEESL